MEFIMRNAMPIYLCIIFSLGVMLIRNLTCFRLRLCFSVCCGICFRIVYLFYISNRSTFARRQRATMTSNVEHSIHTYALNRIWINFQWLNFGAVSCSYKIEWKRKHHSDVWVGRRKEKEPNTTFYIEKGRKNELIGNIKVKSVNWLDGDILSEQSKATERWLLIPNEMHEWKNGK